MTIIALSKLYKKLITNVYNKMAIAINIQYLYKSKNCSKDSEGSTKR